MHFTTRRLAVLATAATLAFAAGCGNKCKNETPGICSTSLGTCTNMAAGQPVTVSFHVSPSCNQASPQCVVILDNVATGTIQFDPQAEACDSSNSCPPPGCAPDALNCAFTAPAAGTYNLVAFDGSGGQVNGTFTSVNGGTTISCLGN